MTCNVARVTPDHGKRLWERLRKQDRPFFPQNFTEGGGSVTRDVTRESFHGTRSTSNSVARIGFGAPRKSSNGLLKLSGGSRTSCFFKASEGVCDYFVCDISRPKSHLSIDYVPREVFLGEEIIELFRHRHPVVAGDLSDGSLDNVIEPLPRRAMDEFLNFVPNIWIFAPVADVRTFPEHLASDVAEPAGSESLLKDRKEAYSNRFGSILSYEIGWRHICPLMITVSA